jgi:hypothetical protein
MSVEASIISIYARARRGRRRANEQKTNKNSLIKPERFMMIGSFHYRYSSIDRLAFGEFNSSSLRRSLTTRQARTELPMMPNKATRAPVFLDTKFHTLIRFIARGRASVARDEIACLSTPWLFVFNFNFFI